MKPLYALLSTMQFFGIPPTWYPAEPGKEWPLDSAPEKMEIGRDVMQDGLDMYEDWIDVAFMEPPEGLIQRFFWSLLVLVQVGVSWLLIPAGIAAFLLEEASQTMGMGAFILSSNDQWEELDTFLPEYKNFLQGAEIGAKTLATLNPVMAGSVVIYMQAAKEQHAAFRATTDAMLEEQRLTEEEKRIRDIMKSQVFQLDLKSGPTNAEIWISGENTEKLTPEQLYFTDPADWGDLDWKKYTPEETYAWPDKGDITITLRKYSRRREEWDIYTFEVPFKAGVETELMQNIPKKITSDQEEEEKKEYGEVRLISTPGEAKIWLDGTKLQLLTPETFDELTPGKHTFKLQRYLRREDQTVTYKGSFTIEADERKEIKIDLHPETQEETEEPTTKEYGIVRLTSTPSEGQIMLDGEKLELLTPETIERITPGKHTFKITRKMPRKDITVEYPGTFTIEKGQRKEIKVDLYPLMQEETKDIKERTEEKVGEMKEWYETTVYGDHAIDGDTFTTFTGEKIRILGIDAPEPGRPYAKKATEKLQGYIKDNNVKLIIQTKRPFDEYGRTLAVARAKGDTIAWDILEEGLAKTLILPTDRYDPYNYRTTEEKAKERGVGIWKEKYGT